MTIIKTSICRKHVELSVIAISNVLVEKGHLCNNFPNPLPQILLFSQYLAYDFAHDIANILYMRVIFVFCTVFGVVNNMQT